MIYLTRLDGSQIVINTDQVLTVEKTPDTKITFVNGIHILVKESVEEVVERTASYRQRVFRDGGVWPGAVTPPGEAPGATAGKE